MASKLILGTAAFGSDYGIKHDGQPSIQEIERIARVAWDGGVRVIHTSIQYEVPRKVLSIFKEFESMDKDHMFPEYFYWRENRGISVYGPELTSESNYAIQYPCNILDKRCLGFYPGMVNIARSVFLQGLLLMDTLPDWVSDKASEVIGSFQGMARLKGLKYYEAALGYVLGLDEVDHVIVGVNSAKQLEQLLQVKPLKWDYDFSIQDEMVLDPRRWPA